MIVGKPTAKQESDWLARVTKYAEEHGEFPKQEFRSFDRHHVKGREFKHNKVAIGRWYVLPIAKLYHDSQMGNQFNVTDWPRRYEIEFGHQVDQFMAMAMTIKDEDGDLPFSNEVLHSIMDLKV